jgi:hypothetical protein
MTSSTISNEFELCCGSEAGFGQVTSYGIHHTSRGGNLTLSNCGGTEKK